MGIGCTITEGGSCAARADSCAAHSLQPGSPVSKVLYLSDIHFDKNYTAGLNAECGEPRADSCAAQCCRPPNGPPRESLCLYTCSNSCTSYDQIPPLYILALVFLQLLASVQPAPGATTTATVPCRPWRPCCRMSARLLKTYLPGKTMYPAVGNHEGAPVNRYSFYMPPSTSPSTVAATMAGSHATGHVCRVCTCGQVMSSWVRTHDYF